LNKPKQKKKLKHTRRSSTNCKKKQISKIICHKRIQMGTRSARDNKKEAGTKLSKITTVFSCKKAGHRFFMVECRHLLANGHILLLSELRTCLFPRRTGRPNADSATGSDVLSIGGQMSSVSINSTKRAPLDKTRVTTQ